MVAKSANHYNILHLEPNFLNLSYFDFYSVHNKLCATCIHECYRHKHFDGYDYTRVKLDWIFIHDFSTLLNRPRSSFNVLDEENFLFTHPTFRQAMETLRGNTTFKKFSRSEICVANSML